ncbi:MAG TPA: hypothetical protein VMT20_10480 [Terriglobia bacterium]|nr:hypothetical protein [Terriglobia bacterium]
MKIRSFLVAAFLSVLATAPFTLNAQQDQPQQDQQQQPQKPPTLGPAPQQKPPTLGESPSLAGPHSANTNDARRLLEVRAVFVDQMDNGLDEKLIEVLGNKGLFRIVGNRRDADAVLRGTCFDSTRLKTVHSEVFLTGRSGESIWQDVIRQPYKPPPLSQAVATTAQAIGDDLASSMRQAQGK